MNTKKITPEDIMHLKVSSLPTRPTAPTAFGGSGYNATQMKEAFDKLPLFIINWLNSLMEDISSTGSGSLSSEIRTNITDTHTLSQMFSDIINGAFASYLSVGDKSLAASLAEIKAEIARIKAQL